MRDALGAFVCAAEASQIARVKLPDALRGSISNACLTDHGDLERAIEHDVLKEIRRELD